MKRVLVTGAGGFIGSHLVEELVREGNTVRAFVKYNGRNLWGHLDAVDKGIMDNVEVICGDIGDTFMVDSAAKNVDTVYHLAALIAIPYSYISPQDFLRVNISGTLNVLEAAKRNNVHLVIHTSTSETYGTAKYVPMDELHPMQAQSPYAATKISADKLVESYHLSYRLPTVTIRPFNTYGPRQSARAVIPTIITQMLSDKKEVSLGNLETVRDFNFVHDTVRGFIKAGTRGEAIGKVINLASGKGVTIQELVGVIKSILGIDKAIIGEKDRIRPEGSEVLQLIGDSKRANDILGWSSQISLEDGLRSTIDYIKGHLADYKTELYNI